MSPEAAVAAAMVALVQPDTPGGKQRLEGLAQTIVAESRPVAFWSGDSGLTATGLMLVAIGYHESKFDEKTRRCLPRPGKYVGLYQMLPGANTRPHTVKEVCASDLLQARLALHVLQRTLDRCPSCSPVHAMRAYASGSAGVDSREAREITSLWHRAALSVGLTVYPYSREQPRVAQR